MSSRAIEIFTLFLSIVTAGSAVALTVWQSQIDIRHNHLSVMPRLDIDAVEDRTNKVYGLYIENNGLGPAYVTRLEFFANGKKITDLGQHIKDAGITVSCFSVIGKLGKRGTAIGPSKSLSIIQWSPAAHCVGHGLDKRYREAQNIKVKVVYKSAYNQVFKAEN